MRSISTLIYTSELILCSTFYITSIPVSKCFIDTLAHKGSTFDPRGVLPEKLGGVVQPASQNPYPIYDQNLWYSLPYLWPDQKFEIQFMTQPLHQNPFSDLRYNKFCSSDRF